MKKLLAITLAAMLLLSVFASCNNGGGNVDQTTNNLENEPPTNDVAGIEKDLAAKIKSAYCEYARADSAEDISPDKLSITRYESAGDCHFAVISDGEMTYPSNKDMVGAGGYLIMFSDNQPFYVYKNEKLLPLREAYTNGLASKKEIYEFGTKADATFKERYPTPPDSEPTQETPESKDLVVAADLGKLSEFLDREGFDGAVSQIKLFDILENYFYEGKSVAKAESLLYFDGFSGGGCQAEMPYFGFTNSFSSSENGQRSSFNDFYTKTALEGLTLPCKIDFSDTLNDVFSKLGIENDPTQDFEDEFDSNGNAILRKNENITFSLKRTQKSDGEIEYKLVFFERLNIWQTRSVEMTFSGTDSKLSVFGMSENDYYSMKKIHIDNEEYLLDGTSAIKSSRVGGELSMYLDTVENQHYIVYVNGEQIEQRSSDAQRTEFAFTMPSSDILIEIEAVSDKN